MGITCIIEFDNNPHGTYFAGQVMTGKVTLKLDKVKLVKAVTFNINGYAETHWTEDTGSGKDRTSDTYSGHEDYIASQTYLAGSNMSSQISLEPGVHVYTFACQIPAICPSSIEGHYGRIRFMTKVALVRPWKFDQFYTRCFTVLNILDLNHDSLSLRMPAHVETQKTYCCWPCKSEPLQMQMTVPQTGFVSGQYIPVSLLVTNDSHIHIEMLQVSLAMMVTYYATHLSRTQSKNERIVVTKMIGDAVPRNCKKQLNYWLTVPATPPTCYDLCRIVKVAYQVEVEAKVKGCHRNLVIVMPITIGSVPLADHAPIQPRAMEAQPAQLLDPKALGETHVAAATAPPSFEAAVPWDMDNNIPPPNYQEALHMRVDCNKVNNFEPTAPQNTMSLDANGFAPLYPIFNMPLPTPPVAEGAAEKDPKGTWL